VWENISVSPFQIFLTSDRRGLTPAQYETVLDDEGLALKVQLKQLHRWSWPLREFSSLIDTQQRNSNSKEKSREEWRNHLIENRWPAHIRAFVPGLFQVIACLQAFCNPANGVAMPFGLQEIGATVDMSGWDEAAGYASPPEDTGLKTIKSLVHRLQKNVSSARDHAYVFSL
jgi:hypothetical protein